MERNEVYRMIDGERSYQQAQGLPDERMSDRWLDSINYYMEQAWLQGEDGEEDRLTSIRKIAALAVAALEQYGCPPREGYEQPAAPQPQPLICAQCNDYLEAPSYCEVCYETMVAAFREAGAHRKEERGNSKEEVGTATLPLPPLCYFLLSSRRSQCHTSQG